MSTKETFPSTTETNTGHYEALPSLQEQERLHGQGSLRNKLVSDLDGKGGYNYLRQGTVTVAADSADLTADSFFAMSDKVKNLRTIQGATERGAELFTNYGKTLRDIDNEVAERRERGESASDITFIYEGRREQPLSGEPHIPSAALVHTENMSREEIAALRDKLPEGVPLLDAKTNRLLDDTGRAERARADHLRRIRSVMSDIALSHFGKFQSRFYADSAGHTTYDTGSTQTYESPGFYASTMDYSGFAMSGTDFNAQPPRNTKVQQSEFPESPEVRTHREQQEQDAWMARQKEYDHGVALQMEDRRSTKKAKEAISQTAYDMYGVEDISKLDEKQVRRVGRVVQKDMHPDLGAVGKADRNASSKANYLISLLEKQARDAAVLDEKTEPTAEATSEPAPAPAAEAETSSAEAKAEEEPMAAAQEETPERREIEA